MMSTSRLDVLKEPGRGVVYVLSDTSCIRRGHHGTEWPFRNFRSYCYLPYQAVNMRCEY